MASLVRGDYGNPDWPRPPVDPLREALFAALEELPRQTVHADPFFSDTTYEYETVGLAVALATVEAVCASFAPSSATASSGSGSTSATGASGSPLLGLAAERLREAAQNALDRGESVGSYHHRAVINALESASPAVPPEGLDVERLRAAISEAQMNLWGRFPGGFSHDDLSAEAAHIYGLSDTGDTPDGAS